MTSPFDVFGNQTWPGNPTVPSSAPPGYTTPQVPNPAKTTPAKTPAQIEALGTALIDGILAQVLLAVANIQIGGIKPFAGLQAWAQQLEAQASGAQANWTTLFEELGLNEATATELASWLSGVNQTANSSQALATTAIVTSSQGLTNWTGLLAGLELTDIPGLSDWLSTAFTNAEQAWNNWVATLQAFEQETISDFTAWLQSLNERSQAASTDVQNIIDAIVQAFNGGETINNAWSSIETNFTDLFDNLLGINNTTTSPAASALTSTHNTLVALSSQIQQQQTVQTGAAQYGQSYTVSFNVYPSGSFVAAPFDVSYSGSGTGALELANGQATWVEEDNGDVSVIGLYITGYSITITGTPTSFTLTYNGQTTSAITYSGVTASAIQSALQALSNMPANNVTVTATSTTGVYDIAFVDNGTLSGATSGGGSIAVAATPGFTNTDYQELQATIGGLPKGTGSKNFACLRMNSTMDTYVYGVVYLASGYTLNWEAGCYVAGVKTVFASGSNAPLNLSFTLRAGVGGNPYRFQGVSGSQIVFDVIDTGTVSQIGSSYRGWGFRSDTANGGQSTPAPASYVGCSDNTLPTTQGSGFRQSCSSTTQQSISIGTNTVPPGASPAFAFFPTSFFDTTDNITSDMTPTTQYGNCSMQIGTSGWYLFEVRVMQIAVSGAEIVSIYAGYLRNGNFESIANGASVAVNVFSTQWAPSSFGGNCPIYCNAGDVITPIIYADSQSSGFLSSLKIFGEANNRLSYWSMTSMFRSF